MLRHTITTMLFLLASLSPAQDVKKEWTETKPKDSSYAVTYSTEGCFVGALKGESGLRIFAYKHRESSKEDINHYAYIRLSAGKEIGFSQEWIINDKNGGKKVNRHEIEEDVIWQNCRKKAELLPASVRRLFNGRWDIQ